MICLAADVDRFRQTLARRLGLHFDDARHDLLTEVLEARVRAMGSTVDAYLACLESERSGAKELRALADPLTVGETYFFRNIEQLTAFEEVALPSRLEARRNQGAVRVLSAGCATGEEPFSLAMLTQAGSAASGRQLVELIAVDLNPSSLARARQGRYSTWSLRATPDPARRRWFRPEGAQFVLDEAIRSAVVFEERNLADPALDLWAAASYDVIFFRNVVMYFTAEQAQAVIGRMERALMPGGFLFLGHAETLRGLSNGFDLCHSNGTFYYQRKGGPAPAAWVPRKDEAWPAAALPDPLGESTSWVEAIRRASARIQALAGVASGPAAPSGPAAASRVERKASRDVERSHELLQEERFSEALDLIGMLPSGGRHSSEVLLLQATLHVHSGQLADAERLCTELLAGDTLNAGAHYLLALCREGAGDPARAIEHDESAAYLDPGFAMPRLHLGLIARRCGDQAAAQREFGRAIALLQKEDPARLLLFGGGFQREALIAVCRAELARCGAQP